MDKPPLGANARLLPGTADIHTLLSLQLFLSGRIRGFTLLQNGFLVFSIVNIYSFHNQKVSRNI